MTIDLSASRDGPAPLELGRRTVQSAFSPADKVPIQSVVRAFSVLEVLAGSPAGLRLADLSRLVGLHKATVFRLLKTMILLGYVSQSADGEPYRVSEPPTGRKRRASTASKRKVAGSAGSGVYF
jgi:hypothetical protein